MPGDRGWDRKIARLFADVAITEPWNHGAQPAVAETGIAVAEPIIIDLNEEILRHLEIVDSKAHVITAIELLSPSNKETGQAQFDWRQKRHDYLRGGINLVEIDLLRNGVWTLPDRSLLRAIPAGRTYHHACVTRPPRWNRGEFTSCRCVGGFRRFALRCGEAILMCRWICKS
jgi:hypothetical protein